METVTVEMTLQRKGKKDIRVELTLSVEDDEIKRIVHKKLQTTEEMN